jgi:hypothetical protein
MFICDRRERPEPGAETSGQDKTFHIYKITSNAPLWWIRGIIGEAG